MKHVIGKRFDNGGMRWIRERAEALLQLRCIETNGDWATFVDFVEERTLAKSKAEARVIRVLTPQPAPLPTFGMSP